MKETVWDFRGESVKHSRKGIVVMLNQVSRRGMAERTGEGV